MVTFVAAAAVLSIINSNARVLVLVIADDLFLPSGPRYLPQRREDGFVLGQRGGPLPDHLHGDGRQREVGLHEVRGDLGGSQNRGGGERN